MKRPHLPGPIERHPRSAITASLLILALGGSELAGYFANPTTPVPKGSCESPFATTGPYVDPDGSQWKTDAGVGEGVTMRVQLPKGAIGVVAGFESPDAGRHGWITSEMVPATGSVTLKYAIGQGWVVFGAGAVTQPHNPAACDVAPAIEVTRYDASNYFDVSGQVPWPNGINDVANLLP